MWKKLFFIPFLIVSVIGSVVYANSMLADPISGIFSTKSVSLFAVALPFVYLSLALCLTAFFFGLIVMLSNNWVIPTIVAFFASLVPLMMIVQSPLNLILGVGFLISFLISMVIILKIMKSYLTFSASTILMTPIKIFLLVLILFLSFAYYSAAESEISAKGFSIPDPLIDVALTLSGANGLEDTTEDQTVTPKIPQINLTNEQIAQLKQNPALLAQFGFTTKDLDALVANQTNQKSNGALASSETNLIKTMVKSQLDNSIKPYLWLLSPALAFSFFGMVISIVFVVLFFFPVLIWLLFWIFEKSGFIHFDKELREVKKLVV